MGIIISILLKHGDVFTSPEIVSYMLDLVGYTADKDLGKTSILEPSCGEGEFVIEIVRRLQDVNLTHFCIINSQV